MSVGRTMKLSNHLAANEFVALLHDYMLPRLSFSRLATIIDWAYVLILLINVFFFKLLDCHAMPCHAP